jgi:Tat protein translocase TatB subunit
LFGSIGGSELLVLAAIGLLVFGPRRLPEMGRTLAGWVNEFRKAAGDMKAAIDREANLGDVRRVAGDLQETIRQEAGKAFKGLEAEAGAVKAGLTTGEEPKGESGGPAAS